VGVTYLDPVSRHHTTRNLARRLEHLGYHVEITPKAA
jgi:hypothetical protein